jgi:oligopeptide transport system ATP-binding protein
MVEPVFKCRDLSVSFSVGDQQLAAVSNLTFDLNEEECLGIVGESGSGKSQTFLATMGLLAPNGRATGSVQYRGQEILNAPRHELDELRGNRIAMVFQDALSGLTPTMPIGRQLSESAERHLGMNSRDARARVLEMLEIVSIPDPEQRLSAYPFELSGGMRQRVMIALAMICRPDVLIADEPTTALDVTVQAQILRLLDGLKRHTKTSVVMITHDLAVVAGLCDRILIMYGGRPVELGTTAEIFSRPQHPYTAGLLRSMPSLTIDPDVDLPAIPGQPPDISHLPIGCAFAERCERVADRCRREEPPLAATANDGSVACHFPLDDN